MLGHADRVAVLSTAMTQYIWQPRYHRIWKVACYEEAQAIVSRTDRSTSLPIVARRVDAI